VESLWRSIKKSNKNYLTDLLRYLVRWGEGNRTAPRSVASESLDRLLDVLPWVTVGHLRRAELAVFNCPNSTRESWHYDASPDYQIGADFRPRCNTCRGGNFAWASSFGSTL